MDTILSSKEQLLDQLNVLKLAWENKFIEIIELSEEDVERWLIRYININDEVYDTLHQLGMYLREMENELFEIKTKHEIIIIAQNSTIMHFLLCPVHLHIHQPRLLRFLLKKNCMVYMPCYICSERT